MKQLTKAAFEAEIELDRQFRKLTKTKGAFANMDIHNPLMFVEHTKLI